MGDNLDEYKQETPPINEGEEVQENDFEYFKNKGETRYYKKKCNLLAISACSAPEFIGVREVPIDMMQDSDIEEASKKEFDDAFSDAIHELISFVK